MLAKGIGHVVDNIYNQEEQHVFEWDVAQCGSKNKYENDMCL